jgi:hypothetical protein
MIEGSMFLVQMLVWSLTATHTSQRHPTYQHDRMKNIILSNVPLATHYFLILKN